MFRLSFLLSFGFLAACGGNTTEVVNSPDIATFIERSQSLPITSPEALPSAGTATFDGFLQFILSNDSEYTGNLDLSLDLGDDSVEGSVTDFSNANGQSIQGSAAIQDGRLDRTVNIDDFFLFVAPLTGTIIDNGSVIEINAAIAGDLRGDGAEQALAGRVVGNADVDNQLQNITQGRFVAFCNTERENCEQELTLAPQLIDSEAANRLRERLVDLSEVANTASVPFSDPLPSFGSAGFEGVMSISTRNEPSLIGDFEISIDLSSDQLNGRVFDIYTQDDFVLDGSLVLSGGMMDRSAVDVNLFSVDMNGLLSDANRSYVVDGSVSGEIYNVDSTLIDGRSQGTLTVGGDSYRITGGRWLGTHN